MTVDRGRRANDRGQRAERSVGSREDSDAVIHDVMCPETNDLACRSGHVKVASVYCQEATSGKGYYMGCSLDSLVHDEARIGRRGIL
jgi:hypothetical protein